MKDTTGEAIRRLKENPKTSIIGGILAAATAASLSGAIPAPYDTATTLGAAFLAQVLLIIFAQD